MMVTFVPPDSGPRLGDRPVTEGVYKNREYERLRETVRALKELREKDKPKGRRKKKAGVSERGPATLGNLSKPSCIIKDPPANYSYSYCQADGGGVQRRWREERIKPGALRVPERSSSCVSCIAGLVSE